MKLYIDRLSKAFIISGAAILLLTGFAKLISSVGTAPIVKAVDPIIGLRNRELFLLVAFMEIGIGISCLTAHSVRTRLLLIAWVSSLFAVYRMGMWMFGINRPCPCLGTLAQFFGAKSDILDTALRYLFYYLLIGSYGALLFSKGSGSVNHTEGGRTTAVVNS